MNEPNVSASWGNLRRQMEESVIHWDGPRTWSGLLSVSKLRGNLRVSGSTSFRIYKIGKLIKNYRRGRICKATPPSPPRSHLTPLGAKTNKASLDLVNQILERQLLDLKSHHRPGFPRLLFSVPISGTANKRTEKAGENKAG